MNATVLAGKRAVITGASRGIGLGITRSLAENGVSCILVGRSANTLDAQIAQLPSHEHSRIVGDVASLDTWSQFEAENVCLDVSLLM
jgi:short-subunit dehydrogenase